MQAGDTGIFVTCHRGKEGKCTGEVLDLLQDYAERIYSSSSASASSSSASASSSRSAAVKEDGGDGEDDGDGDAKKDGNGGEEVVDDDDIEKEILAEVREIRKPKVARLFTPVQLNVQCGKCACHLQWGRENGSMLTHHCRYQSSFSKQHPQSSQFL